MKHIRIYTDASVGFKNIKQYAICGIIVCDSRIIDIYYRHRFKYIPSIHAEALAIYHSISYVKEKYNTEKIVVYSDAILENRYNNITIEHVKAHQNSSKKLRHKFNCLADHISKYGLENWEEWWHNKLKQ